VTPRVALSGSAGTGKTTLGMHLAERLGLPFIEEGMRARVREGLDPSSLTHAQYEDLIEQMFEEQREQERRAVDGFVADRSSIDFAAFWLHYARLADRDRTERVVERCVQAGAAYDAVLLLPWGSLPLADDGVRSTDRWLQFRFQAIVEGLHERFTPADRLFRAPADLLDPERRLRWALEAVAGR
jgi:nicotinamide riboside kinase